jgi:hypothetical protein
MFINTKSPVTHSVYRVNLKKKIAASQKQIREKLNCMDPKIVPRTQPINAKRPYQTLEEEQTIRKNVLADHIKIWRRTLPTLIIKSLSRIPDPRHPKSVKGFSRISSPIWQ